MKFKLFPILALLLAVSCSKDGNRDCAVQVHLSLPGTATKVTLADEDAGTFPMVWQEGDQVSLNGTMSGPMSAGLSGKDNAAFSFADFSGSAPYHLLYPGAADEKVTIDGKTLPLYATGASLDQVFTMHHLCCGVRLSLTGDLTLASLSLSAPGGEKIAGVFSPSFADGTLTLTMTHQWYFPIPRKPSAFSLRREPSPRGYPCRRRMRKAPLPANGVSPQAVLWRKVNCTSCLKLLLHPVTGTMAASSVWKD